jgi:CheY-like chemotaxis protein
VIDQTPVSSKTEKLFGDVRKIRPLKILVVDDSMPIRKMCCMILQKQGHQVATAMNGKEALHLMKTACAEQWSSDETKTAMPLDLVLMDFQMPVMDGIEAVTLYREYEKGVVENAGAMSPIHKPNRLAVVGMSACSDHEIIDRGLACGMDHFIGKPFQIQQLQPIMMQLFPHHVDKSPSSTDEEELKHSEKVQQ